MRGQIHISYSNDKLTNGTALNKLDILELAVRLNLDNRNLMRNTSSPDTLTKSQNKNFATVLVQYEANGKTRIEKFHGASHSDNKNTEFHGERIAWEDAKDQMKQFINDGAKIKKIVVVSELPLCPTGRYENSCEDFFIGDGGATKGKENELKFDPHRDSVVYVVDGELRDVLKEVNEVNSNLKDKYNQSFKNIEIPRHSKREISENKEKYQERERKRNETKSFVEETNKQQTSSGKKREGQIYESINLGNTTTAKGKEREKVESSNSKINNRFQSIGGPERKQDKRIRLMQLKYNNVNKLEDRIKKLDEERTAIKAEIDKLKGIIQDGSTNTSLAEFSKKSLSTLYNKKIPIDRKIDKLKKYIELLDKSEHDNSPRSTTSVGKEKDKKTNENTAKSLVATRIDSSMNSDNYPSQFQQSSQYMKIGAMSAGIVGIAGVAIGSYLGIGIMLPTFLGVAATIVGGLVGARIDTNLSAQAQDKEKKEAKSKKKNKSTPYAENNKKEIINSKVEMEKKIQKNQHLANENSNFKLHMFKGNTESSTSLTKRANSKGNDITPTNNNRNHPSNNKKKNSKTKYKK